MTDLDQLRFHVDSPGHWRPEVLGIEVVGWLYPGEQGTCVDLRSRVDGRVHLGIYGLDRADTQAAFGGSTVALRSGFIQRAVVWAGARELALDFHDGREWREFFRTALDTSALPLDAKRPKPELRAGVVFQTLQYLYRHFHRASWSDLCRETDAVLRDVLTANSDVIIGNRFLGHIENPGYWINAGYGKFRVTGWIFDVGHPIQQLSATTGVLTENRLVFPKDRADVAAHRSDHANALKSGYYGLVDIRADTPSPANLKIYAEVGDGHRRIAFARRMYLDRRDEHSGPIPVFKSFYFYKVLAAFLRGAQFSNCRR